ncbi:GNAT family N-acetyltransferase [Streptomyces sp. NBC_01304]|uniref:GNAT family N-acetyltransferase n=1 Tax=Streptomyces sp. NBC_01304 TaxID=2903818 RepID=UPI002E0EAA3B|nr:GNAT family N-acetyltransferase [Streptomyces sp. NBC_01304]
MNEPAEWLSRGPAQLRRWRSRDAETVYQLVEESVEHLRPWMPWVAEHSREKSADFVARCEADWSSRTGYKYAIWNGDSVAGCCALVHRGFGGMEIGYWLHPAFTGRGLATSAASALTRQAFALRDIGRVEIIHDEANEASAAVPRRLGFIRVESRPVSAPSAPADTGVDVVWRIERSVFGNGICG